MQSLGNRIREYGKRGGVDHRHQSGAIQLFPAANGYQIPLLIWIIRLRILDRVCSQRLAAAGQIDSHTAVPVDQHGSPIDTFQSPLGSMSTGGILYDIGQIGCAAIFNSQVFPTVDILERIPIGGGGAI